MKSKDNDIKYQQMIADSIEWPLEELHKSHQGALRGECISLEELDKRIEKRFGIKLKKKT